MLDRVAAPGTRRRIVGSALFSNGVCDEVVPECTFGDADHSADADVPDASLLYTSGHEAERDVEELGSLLTRVKRVVSERWPRNNSSGFRHVHS